MNTESLEYIGILTTGMILILIWKAYKKGDFKKENREKEEPYEKLSSFGKWWRKSYLRDIYVVRASQRKALCALPWIGVFVSSLAVFTFIVISYLNIIQPPQPIEKLLQYDGVLLDYTYYKKSSNIITFQIKDGEIKYFSALIRKYKKNEEQEWIGKEMSIWVQKEWGILTGDYEKAVWKEFDYKPMDKEAFIKVYKKRLERNKIGLKYLPIAFLSLLSFLFLIWLINLNPVKNNKRKESVNSEE